MSKHAPAMENLYWCSTCKEMYEKSSHHGEHEISKLGGDDESRTIVALDEIIQFGLASLQNREQEVQNARQVKDDINELREKFTHNSRARIERIVNDLRVAMEDCAGQLLTEVNKKVADTELKCQSVITTSRAKLDTVKSFIQQSAMTLPDEDGRLHPTQLGQLYAYYKTVKNLENQPRARIKHVDVNVKYPNSYQRKNECQALAKSICGEVENPKRNSFLHMDGDTMSEEVRDVVMPLVKPQRKISRDLLRN